MNEINIKIKCINNDSYDYACKKVRELLEDKFINDYVSVEIYKG